MADSAEARRMRLKVVVRLRPTGTDNENSVCEPEADRVLYLKDPSKAHTSEFLFDRVFPAPATQGDIFTEVGRPLVDHVLEGYNACCFAYGQTGSGKTYTMFGKDAEEWDVRGVIPRSCEYLFTKADEIQRAGLFRFTFHVSFLEIYLEQVQDLGKAVQMKGRMQIGSELDRPLEIMEDNNGATLIKDLTYTEVKSVSDVMAMVTAGSALRQTASTGQNDVSSRSHTVFTITVVQYPLNPSLGPSQPVTGRLNLVDLAGSERLSKSNSEGQRLKETKSINTSLTALGKVVMILSSQEGDKERERHVPFRDSKLTRILKDSLSGNCYTTLLATLNPTPDNAEECNATLQFALRCSAIATTPHVNVLAGNAGNNDAIVESLTAQIAQLREDLDQTHAHYQKMIEQIAGPGWSADIGPVERDVQFEDMVGLERAGGTGGGAAGGDPGTSEGTPTASGRTLSQNMSTKDLNRLASGRKSAISAGGARQMQSIEASKKIMEMQLDSAKRAAREAEEALSAKKGEFNEMRDRLLAGEHKQFQEVRRLNQRIADLQASLQDERQLLLQQREEQAAHFEEEHRRLLAEMDRLRLQLGELTSAVPSMLEARASSGSKQALSLDAVRSELDGRFKKQVAEVERAKQAQIDNIRQQQTAIVSKKAEDVASLRAELASVRNQSNTEIAALKEECDYLFEYAEKVTAIVHRIENGRYAIQERAGLRSFKIPARDKPAALAPERLRYIRSKVNLAERFLNSTAGSAPPSPFATQLGGAMPMQNSWVQSGGSFREDADSEGGQTASLRAELSTAMARLREVEVQSSVTIDEARREWEARERAAVTARVMADLTSEPTVEYIRQLESEVEHCRKELRSAGKRTSDLAVALRSAGRTAGSDCGSPVGSAMNTQRSALSSRGLPRPTQWTMGNGSMVASPPRSPSSSMIKALLPLPASHITHGY